MSHQIGERVVIHIPDSTDPDHQYHGEFGTIVEVTSDDLGEVTGEPRNDQLYLVEFEDDTLGTMTFRHHDLRQEGS
jgi:ribosomal protein L21E